jgi:hypothetical protein
MQPNATGVNEGPSLSAYPSLVATSLGLTLSVRNTNCPLDGDDLAVSGAPMSSQDALTGAGGQCAVPTAVQHGRNTAGQDSAAGLVQDPASLVTIQAGADDIDFSTCLLHDITHFAGTECVSNGHVISTVATKLQHVEAAITATVKALSPYAGDIAVLGYYDPVPAPEDFQSSTEFHGAAVDPVCFGLAHNQAKTYSDSVVIQAALNSAIRAGVNAAGVSNAMYVNIENVFDHHEMCTGSSAVFAGEPMGVSAAELTELGLCVGGAVVATAGFSPFSVFGNIAATLAASLACEPIANTIKSHFWRAAHPNSYGQQDIANALVQALASAPTTPPT